MRGGAEEMQVWNVGASDVDVPPPALTKIRSLLRDGVSLRLRGSNVLCVIVGVNARCLLPLSNSHCPKVR